MVENGRKWQEMAENGGKWSKKVHRGYLVGNGLFACFTPWTPRQPGNQVENGRKWPKMGENGRKKVHRGYLVGNGKNDNHNSHGYRTFQHSCFTHEC